jgi:hypothetical protein
MGIEQEQRYLFEAAADGHQLGEHILTLAAVREHLLKAAHLALNPAQAGACRFGVCGGRRKGLHGPVLLSA